MDIDPLFFTAAAAFIAFIVTVVGIVDKYKSEGATLPRWQRLKMIGYPLIVLSVISLFITLFGIVGSFRKTLADAQAKRASDSTQTAEINRVTDSNRKGLFKDLGEAFNKQGVKFDSLNKVVTAIRDSVRDGVSRQPEILPVLEILDYGITIDSSKSYMDYMISIKSAQAASTRFKIQTYFEIFLNNGVKEVGYFPSILPYDNVISANEADQIHMTVSKQKHVDSIRFYMAGEYFGLNSKVRRKMDDIYLYDGLNKKTYYFSGTSKKKLQQRIVNAYHEVVGRRRQEN